MAQVKLEDSNIAGYGSKDHKDLKLAAAKSEKAWAGCGKKPGVEIWRIEKFQVVPKNEPEMFGKFFGGDCYIVLHTYKAKDAEGKEVDKLLYNVHFWLGAECSQDDKEWLLTRRLNWMTCSAIFLSNTVKFKAMSRRSSSICLEVKSSS
jgi:hypothetical protein